MNINDLEDSCKEYKENEGRERFYDIALSIVDDHPLQASIIILSTWNSASFGFKMSNPENIKNLMESMETCKPLFDKIKDKEIQTANLDEIRDVIKEVYRILSKVQLIKYTGASKVMHLINRNLFVMWDGFIRKGYGFGTDAEDYFNFLKLMQSDFKGIKWNDKSKTLAKAIDEYNYVKFSL
ncbi:MAG: hypothetical protein WA139_00145 [Candidatus Aenigmatarchaeota archaeon]